MFSPSNLNIFLLIFLLCLTPVRTNPTQSKHSTEEGSGEYEYDDAEFDEELENLIKAKVDELNEGSGEFQEEKTYQFSMRNEWAQGHSEGEALPIVVPNIETHSFSLNSRLLEQVLLDPRVADKKVALVAVAGEFRKGKSFLLNFFLRYLAHNLGNSNEGNWLDPKIPLASQFSFKRGTQTHTKGILLWSEPFLTRNPHTGEELAILLMDTQGSFDDESSLQENAIIFSLSTMVSSTLIYNIGGQIKSSDLQYLQFFAKYAELALEGRNGTEGAEEALQPFQSLLFLVRDWANSQEMEFGFQGGQQLLAQHLTARENDTPEMRKLRSDIRHKLFQSVRCFLMPYPGKTVAGHGKTTFSGNLTDIDGAFLNQMRIFVPALFSHELLQQKVIEDLHVTGKDLAAYFHLYFDIFNTNSSMPNVENVYEATSKLNCELLADRAYKFFEYSVELYNANANAIFENIKNYVKWLNFQQNYIITEIFDQIRLIGNSQMIAECRAKLRTRIDAAKPHYEAIHQQKIDKRNEERAQRQREEQLRQEKLEKERLEREQAEAAQRMRELEKKLEEERREKERLRAEAEEHRRRVQQIQQQQQSQRSECDSTKRTLGGGFLGGVVGFMLGGPIGAAIGAAGGGYVGNSSC